MEQYISKSALMAEIEKCYNECLKRAKIIDSDYWNVKAQAYRNVLAFLNDALEVKNLYEQCVQYDSIKAGIQAHAEEYSFNIESELFNQLTKEQQKLWRKEIEQACISGGEMGVELIRDARYKEDLEAKEVDIEKELVDYHNENFSPCDDGTLLSCETGSELTWYDYEDIAKHFFELGVRVNNPITAADRGMAEEIIINLKRLEKDYRIDLTKEMEWLRNKAQKGE